MFCVISIMSKKVLSFLNMSQRRRRNRHTFLVQWLKSFSRWSTPSHVGGKIGRKSCPPVFSKTTVISIWRTSQLARRWRSPIILKHSQGESRKRIWKIPRMFSKVNWTFCQWDLTCIVDCIRNNSIYTTPALYNLLISVHFQDTL